MYVLIKKGANMAETHESLEISEISTDDTPKDWVELNRRVRAMFNKIRDEQAAKRASQPKDRSSHLFGRSKSYNYGSDSSSRHSGGSEGPGSNDRGYDALMTTAVASMYYD